MINSALAGRELVNCAAFITGLCLVALFVWHLGREMPREGWYDLPRNRAAIALLMLFTGETIRAGWVWTLLRVHIAGGNPHAIESNYQLLIVSTVLTCIGTLCCVQFFSPARWGHWGWIGTSTVTVGFIIITRFF